MNIVTPNSANVLFTNVNVSTEAARRDNLAREVIPASKDAEQGASQQGLGSDSDRARQPGQKPAPVTYERPLPLSAEALQQQNAERLQGENQTPDGQLPDNGADESAGRETAQEKQQQQNEEQQIEELEARDAEVRRHEQAHAAAGGQHAGSPQYSYEQGPDGERYATGGEVSIDVSEAESPEQTIQKMQQVRRAALAPAEPSAQDRSVAAEASQKANEARQELAAESTSSTAAGAQPVREDNAPFSVSQNRASGVDENELPEVSTESLEMNNAMQSRIGVIQQFYQNTSAPRAGGFSAVS